MEPSSNDTSANDQVDLIVLRRALQGRNLVVNGGSWTAEAREPDRNRRLHAQLRLARQLRVTMENAADKAEQSTKTPRQIIMQLIPSINELVSLTEAVQGSYTLDDYHEYTRLLQKEEDIATKEMTHARDIIVRQLLALTEEKQPTPARRQSSLRVADHSSSYRSSAYAALAPEFSVSTLPVGSSSVDTESSLKRSSTSTDVTAPSMHKRRNIVSRRCHDCKSGTTNFRRCQYWLLTGTKCGKTFCSKCLEIRYGDTDIDSESPKNDPQDWHCPSCQGTCLCPDCVKDRKGALQRACKNGISRRSARTTTASSFTGT